MLIVKEEIPSKLLSEYKPNSSFMSSVENIFIEINLRLMLVAPISLLQP